MPHTNSFPTLLPWGAEGGQAARGLGERGVLGGHHGFGPPKHGTSLALSAVEGCKRELGTPTPGPLHREALPRCSRVAGQGRNYEHGEGGWGSVCLVLGM